MSELLAQLAPDTLCPECSADLDRRRNTAEKLRVTAYCEHRQVMVVYFVPMAKWRIVHPFTRAQADYFMQWCAQSEQQYNKQDDRAWKPS